MADYRIRKLGNSVNIARSEGQGAYSMWCSYNCEWKNNNHNAWGAFLGFEDGFYPISESEAMEIIKSYECK